ncbi:AAA family ATPase, partial [uncultured Aeromicrobium sp.]|uniref:AAA family ATPase n=1 Tax=uncultured Aeromicrobium sp. TaxID=337820 RepID=UPI0025D1363F
MRVLRLVLENFRGIEGPREIVFAERGVTLIEGPNEAGKSSIAEALRLLRDFKASSQAAEVRAVRPTHVQADPRIEVELRTGPYHLVYAKTFGRKGATQLTVRAPKTESHTGDTAHDRASAIFAETVDTELWRALHLVQGRPLDQPVLADLEPLHLALAERDAGEGTEVHAELLDRVEQEYLTYFTATGRPTGEYARLRDDLDAAIAQQRQALAEVENVARLIERHERLRLRRDELDVELADQRKEVQSLRERSDALDQLRDECREARQVAHGAQQSALAARRAQQRRAELLEELAAAQEALELAEQAAARARGELGELESAPPPSDPNGMIDAAREALDAAAARLEAARAESEWRRAHEQLERAQEAVRQLREASESLAAHTVTAEVLAALVDAHTAWRTAEARSLAGAPQILVERLGETAPELDGVPMAGDTAQIAALRPTVVELPDGVRITVSPDAQIAERADEAADAQQTYRRLLAQAGVRDLDDARERAARRDEAQRQVDTAAAALRAVLDGATEAELAAEVAALN